MPLSGEPTNRKSPMPGEPTSRRNTNRRITNRNQNIKVPRNITSSGETVKANTLCKSIPRKLMGAGSISLWSVMGIGGKRPSQAA